MKAILEMDMPEKCLYCMVAWHETGEDGELLVCLPLSEIHAKEIEGEFLSRRQDCPLKEVRE